MNERRGQSPYTPEDIKRVFGDAYPLELLADKKEVEQRITADQAELDGGVSEEREVELRAELELNRKVLGEIGTQLKRKLASYATTKT